VLEKTRGGEDARVFPTPRATLHHVVEAGNSKATRGHFCERPTGVYAARGRRRGRGAPGARSRAVCAMDSKVGHGRPAHGHNSYLSVLVHKQTSRKARGTSRRFCSCAPCRGGICALYSRMASPFVTGQGKPTSPLAGLRRGRSIFRAAKSCEWGSMMYCVQLVGHARVFELGHGGVLVNPTRGVELEAFARVYVQQGTQRRAGVAKCGCGSTTSRTSYSR